MLTNFLKQIVPADSIICLARMRAHGSIGRPKLNFNNQFYTLAELPVAEQVIAEWNKGQDTDVYFGVAGYASKASRKKTNVDRLKTLILDVDIKDKPDHWHSKTDAIKSIKRLCAAVPALPRPLIVDSGRGYHVYFLLKQAVPQAVWLPLAEAFRDTVRLHEPKLIADPVRTCDAASVLRVPGTINAKEKGNPLPVKVVVNGASPADYEELLAAMNGVEASGLGLPPAYAQGANNFSIANPHRREFKDIEPRPVLTECAQMRHHVETKGAVTEPEWLLACRVYVTLRNGDKIAHKFSNPAFSGIIDRKLKHARTNFDAPSTACKEWPNQERCRGCQWASTVLFPVEIAEQATAARETEEAQAKAVAEAAQAAVSATTLTTLPTGYLNLRAAYDQVTTPDGREFTHVPGVSKDDPTATAPLVRGHMNIRYATAERTANGWSDIRIHMDITINGYTSSVTVPAVELTAERADSATKTLRHHGMTFDSDTVNKKKALTKMFAHMVEIASARIVPYFPRKGWDEDFPYGRQPLSVGAMRYTPAGAVERGVSRREHIGSGMQNESIVEAFCSGVPRGTLLDWQQGMAIYNRPGMELAQMLMLSGVANLLLPLVSQSPGGILLALTGESGVGKTTLLRFLSSFVGNPSDAMIPGSSTSNALVNMLSQAGFLLLPVDDSFKMDATALSLLLTSVSSGMEKARMSGAADRGWVAEMGSKFNSSLIVTTNFDVGTIIGSGRSSDAQLLSDAGRSRLLEVSAANIKVPYDVTPAQWRNAEALILENYGHALDVFARHVSTQQGRVGRELRTVESDIHNILLTGAPVAARGVLRFWAKYLACVTVAGRILTVDQPILPWDIDKITNAGIALVIEQDQEASVDKQGVVDAMWDILLDDKDGKHLINFSYMVATDGANWPHWDDAKGGQARGRMREWDDGAVGNQLIQGHQVPGATLVRLYTAFDWRVVLTRVLNRAGKTLRFEREVLITLPAVENIISYHSGRKLKVVDWLEAYDAFMLNGSVTGVKVGKPKRYADDVASGMCRLPIDARPGMMGSRRRCLKLSFPPLEPHEVEPA